MTRSKTRHGTATLALAVLLGAPSAGRAQSTSPATGTEPAPATSTDPAPATSAGPALAASAEAEDGGGGWSWWAVATESVRARSARDPDDSATDLRLDLDGGATGLGDRFALKAALGLWWTVAGQPEEGDVAGVPEAGEGQGWAPIHASADSPLWLDVYQLAAEYRGAGALRKARLGRMEAEVGPLALFDGASVALAPWGGRPLTLSAFGGRTVHFFELEQGLTEDLLGSIGAEYWFGRDVRVVADYRLLREELMTRDVLDDPAAEKEDVTDHLYGVEAWWRRGDLRARGYARGLDDRLAFVGGAAGWLAADAAAGLDARVDVQTVDLDELLAEREDPYLLTLGTSLAHGRARIDAWKAIAAGASTLTLHAGGDGRMLLGGDAGAFNRNFGRGYLLVAGDDLGVRGLFASASLEYHFETLDDEGLLTAAGGLGYARGRARVEAGTSYHRWKYVYYQTPEETPDVRSVYADARFKVRDWLALKGHYGYEVFDRTLHTVIVSITQAY